MSESTKNPFIIIGGGLIGLSIAHQLARKKINVIILSRRRNEAAGFVAAGMLAPHAEGLTNQLLKLGQKSLELHADWIKEIENDSGLNCGLRKCGIVVPFKSNQDKDNYATAEYGEHLNRDQLEKIIPGIASQWSSGILFEQDGQIDNRRLLMRALEKACFELGVNFCEGVEVMELICKNQNFKGVYVRNAEGKIHKIISNNGILCSGAWSNRLLPELPIFPVKGQMLSIQGPINAFEKIIFGPGTYLVPREDGLIIVGATNEKDAGFREGLTPHGQTYLHNGIKSLMPKANLWPPMERWWGFRPCTPDENPILGESAFKGLWIATGHYRNGVLLASVTASLIKKSILRNELNEHEQEFLKNFSWKRFSKN